MYPRAAVWSCVNRSGSKPRTSARGEGWLGWSLQANEATHGAVHGEGCDGLGWGVNLSVTLGRSGRFVRWMQHID